jgi:mono/diheme cytochrome c family protein
VRRELLLLAGSGLAAAVLLVASALVLLFDGGQEAAAGLDEPASQPTGSAAELDGVAGQPTGAAAVEYGRALFSAKGCSGCHSLGPLRAGAPVGPDLTALPTVSATRKPGLSAEGYVRESLASPQAFVVPGFGPQMPLLSLSEAETQALIAFLLAPREAR